MRSLSPSRLIACAVLAFAANGALAQYVWVDDKGVKQFSDRPPPPSVPQQNIIRQPRATIQAAPAAEAAPAPKPAGPALAEREAEFRKRAQDKAEREQKAAEEARERAARQQACNAARAYLAQLESGERIGSVAANGERGFMSDAERARQAAGARRALAACK